MQTRKDTLKLLLSSFSEDSSNIIVKADTFPISKFPLHTHNFFEIEFVVSGKGTQIINGKKYRMYPGMFYFLSPSDSHEVHYKESTSIINISFSHNILPTSFENLLIKKEDELIFYAEKDEIQYFLQLFQTIHKEFNEKTIYFEKMIENYLSILLLIISRKSKISLDSNESNNLISKATSYIQLHFTENPTLNTVASHVGLTASHFTTILKQYTGFPYLEYLTNLKIAYAKKLLKSNQHTITEIVYACGFNSICNFNRVFKRKIGISPSQYRKKYLTSIKK